MKRALAERARQAEALEKQLKLQQQERVTDDVVAVTNAKEFNRGGRTIQVQAPLPSDPILPPSSNNNSGNRTPSTPKIGKPGIIISDATATSSSSTSSSSTGAERNTSSHPTIEHQISVKRDTPSISVSVDNHLLSSSPTNDEVRQRPIKMQKLQNERNTSISHGAQLSSTNNGVSNASAIPAQSNSQVLSSRRLSLDPQHTGSNNNIDTQMDDNHSSNDTASSFYLKHQNRALATELKSYHYTVSELEQERDRRRSHCYTILQTLQQLQCIWNAMEDGIISSNQNSKRRQHLNGDMHTDNNNNTNDTPSVPASTGTDDAVEWTQALLKALTALGHGTIAERNDNANIPLKNGVIDHNDNDHIDRSTADIDFHAMEESVNNITARAKVLQEWIQEIIQNASSTKHIDRIATDSTNTTSDNSGNDNDNDNASTSIQQQMTELVARCTTLEGQVTELVQCRTDLQQRERRLRRNIYRMAANLVTPEQVVNSAMTVPDDSTASSIFDDIETAVQIEKKELLLLKQEHQALIDKIHSASTNTTANSLGNEEMSIDGIGRNDHRHVSHLLTKQIEEYQSKVTILEESLASAEQSIQELHAKLKEKEHEITKLSQRQLSDEDRSKLESIPATLLRLQSSEKYVDELQSKLKITEQKWSQALGNEKAALHTVSDLIQKFNKRWTELTANAYTIRQGSVLHSLDTANQPSLTSENDKSEMNDENAKVTDESGSNEFAAPNDLEMTNEHPQIQMSKQIQELQHKLQQAMENVRQAEVSREHLKMALSMNTTLQTKLDEMKTKYAAIQNSTRSGSTNTGIAVSSKNPSTTNSKSANHNSVSFADDVPSDAINDNDMNGTLSKTDSITNASSKGEKSGSSVSRKEKDGSKTESKSRSTESSSGPTNTAQSAQSNSGSTSRSSASSSEKLHRDYRKVRKELAAMTSNYNTLMANNARLLKQITEKDEMNAKSLSTILHLKSMTEKLVEERDHLGVQMKNASQLALAARLATNAKDRVSEELVKEKDDLDKRRNELEEQLHTTNLELQRISVDWSNASSIIATKDTELANIIERSNQLIEENSHQRDEIRKLNNTLSQAQRDALEANEKLQDLLTKSAKDDTVSNKSTSLGSSSSSSFTMEQLQTQVSVLKNRLACPVCHYRDKECIIIRCRHMHCKQCVDERVSNRSRKCPTCNVKFAENEVETIFLS